MSDSFAEKPKEGEAWDVAIVGSGPSGLTAAIYTTRGAASTLILAGNTWGGQLMLTTDVDNFPGFPKGIQGPDLMKAMRDQAERFGAEVIDSSVDKINVEGKPFELTAGDKIYKANSIIIATGAETIWLGVPGEEKLRGRGVSSCAPCDAPFFKNKKVAVIGGGDAAMEEALVLTKYASSVTMIHRRDAFKASQAMQKRVMDLVKPGKIELLWNSEVKEFKGEDKLESLNVFNNKTNKTEDMAFEGAFVAIGHKPSTSIFTGKIDLDEKGYVLKKAVDGFNMRTSVEGVFVAGDVHDHHYKQAITAAGFGCMAGMEALNYLDKDTPTF